MVVGAGCRWVEAYSWRCRRGCRRNRRRWLNGVSCSRSRFGRQGWRRRGRGGAGGEGEEDEKEGAERCVHEDATLPGGGLNRIACGETREDELWINALHRLRPRG